MSNPHSLPDYKERYFEYKDLDKVHGRPTIDGIIKVFRQLKRNAQRIPTSLGGGNHGYLALLLSPNQYDAIPTTQPFIRPANPGIYSIPAGRTTAAEISLAKAQYDESLRLFNEVRAVETLLRNQLINAFDSDYLEALRDTNDMISSTIPQIMTYLTSSYGKVSEEQFEIKEKELKDFIYNPSLPIDIVFNKIDFFSDLCDMTNNTLTDRRKIQLAYLILSRARVFRESLKDWNKKATADKTYSNMKIFMRQEYSDLEAVGALTLEDSSLNHAKILQELKDNQAHLAQTMEEQLKVNLVETLDSYARFNQENVPPSPQVGNLLGLPAGCRPATNNPDDASNLGSISNVSTESAILSALQELTKQVANIGNANNGNNTNDDNNGTNRSNNNKSSTNPRTGRAWRRYCWSCGCCNHWGRNCPNRKPGHQNDATFKDRKGGSTVGVLGL